MTPKEQYEARKAERQKLKDLDYQVRQQTEQLMMMDIFDRFVTAVERIADAMDRPEPRATAVGPFASTQPRYTSGMSEGGVG